MSTKRMVRLEKKRSLILKKAKEILIHRGRDAGMADIAESLNMDTSSVYYYFKGIPEIINTLLLDEYHDLTALHRNLREEGKSSVEILERLLNTILDFYHSNLEIMQIILSQISPLFLTEDYKDPSIAINNYLQSYWSSNTSLLEEIEQGQERGEITGSVQPNTILCSFRGAIFGICSAWRGAKPKKSAIPEIAKRLVAVYKR